MFIENLWGLLEWKTKRHHSKTAIGMFSTDGRNRVTSKMREVLEWGSGLRGVLYVQWAAQRNDRREDASTDIEWKIGWSTLNWQTAEFPGKDDTFNGRRAYCGKKHRRHDEGESTAEVKVTSGNGFRARFLPDYLARRKTEVYQHATKNGKPASYEQIHTAIWMASTDITALQGAFNIGPPKIPHSDDFVHPVAPKSHHTSPNPAFFISSTFLTKDRMAMAETKNATAGTREAIKTLPGATSLCFLMNALRFWLSLCQSWEPDRRLAMALDKPSSLSWKWDWSILECEIVMLKGVKSKESAVPVSIKLNHHGTPKVKCGTDMSVWIHPAGE